MANVDVWAGFMIFHDDYDRLRFLPGDQKLKVLDAVCEFSKSGEVVDMGEPMMNIVYDILIKAVTRARAKSINAKKGHANKGVGKDDADADSAESCNVLQIPAHFCNDLHTSGDTCAPMQHKDKGKPDAECKADGERTQNVPALDTSGKPPARAKFVPPTIDEVADYCQERNNYVNPSKWYDHYLAVDWMVGKNKMKDWRAAVRKWEQNGFNNSSPETHSETIHYGFDR